jgi:hypothetical protein
MTDESSCPLADVYAAWALLRDLTVADVQRASGLARHTIENIRDGGGRQSSRKTLRRLAVGLATDKRPGRYHEDLMKEIERELLLAGNYGDPAAAEARSLMDLALFYRFRSPAKAHAWAALMERYEDVEPAQLWTLLSGLRAGPSDDIDATKGADEPRPRRRRR